MKQYLLDMVVNRVNGFLVQFNQLPDHEQRDIVKDILLERMPAKEQYHLEEYIDQVLESLEV